MCIPLGIRLPCVEKRRSMKAIWIGTEMKTHPSFNTNCLQSHQYFFSFIPQEQILFIYFFTIFFAASPQPPVALQVSTLLVAACDGYTAAYIHAYIHI